MAFLRNILALLLFVGATGCQLGYLVNSAYNQTDLMLSREPIEKVLEDPKVDEEKKRKLRLVQEAHKFAEEKIGLSKSANFTSYVELGRPYVTYVVSAAPKNKLEHHLWHFPLVGSLPYKGYFNPESAKAEAEELKKQNLDVFVRGVSAYSTLGWFHDPLLSSMLRYEDYDLVNTVIHELTHMTVFINNATDFNERIANFVGNKGSIAFYTAKEGNSSPTVKSILQELHDDRIFSAFISEEVSSLEKWYTERDGHDIDEKERKQRIHEVQVHFTEKVRPQVAKNYRIDFETGELNNAKILLYKLYENDLIELEKLYEKSNNDFFKLIEFLKSLEKEKDPESKLKEAIQG